ncbi:hypothetical protein OFY01_28855, partial [Streptomyces sp. GXMU-J5]|nr:hypothetical protein [Streptomyces beihaiensis]
MNAPATAPCANAHLTAAPGDTRLLAGWYADGRAAALDDHLSRYGPPSSSTAGWSSSSAWRPMSSPRRT